MPDDITNIPSARSQFLNPDGTVNRVWYLFLFNQFNLTGAGGSSTTLDDVQLLDASVQAPPVDSLIQQIALLNQQPVSVDAMRDQLESLLLQPVLQPLVNVEALQHQIDLALLTPSIQPTSNPRGFSGRATLVSGTVTILTPRVSASSEIMLTYRGTLASPGVLSVGTITDFTSFVINSTSATDTSTVSWLIINP